jgi:UDP-GlcNAc:undecaprenyl-phosphate GlcNAc-1-phosphate transferase
MVTFSLRDYLVLFFFPALLLALWLTPLAIHFARRVNAVDLPDNRKIHSRAIVRLGGLSMLIALAVPLLFSLDLDRRLIGFLVGLLVAAVTGLIDDLFRLSTKQKFAGEILAASAFILISGTSLESFGNLLGFGEITTGVLALPITIFCMVGVMNALNLSDGLDGLAAGLAAIACGFLGLSAYLSRDYSHVAIMVALVGAVVGFLRYNTFPARLFMGDSGSLVLGYSLAALSVMTVFRDGTGIHQDPITVAGILALPIIDTLVVMTRRAVHGENPFRPDRTHLHHRLMDLGLPHAAVVSIMYATMAMFGSIAWSIRFQPEWVRFLTIAGLGMLVYGSVYLAQHSNLRSVFANLREIRIAEVSGIHAVLLAAARRSARMGGWILVLALVVPAVFMTRIQEHLGVSALSAGFFVAVFFPWRSSRIRGAIAYGLIFLGLVALLSLYHFFQESPAWIGRYLLILALIALTWIILKVKYRAHNRILLLSSFEFLCIGTALFVALVVLPTLGAEDTVVRTMFTVCIESIVFLLAFKIIVRRVPEGRYLVLATFLLAFGLLAGRGLLFRKAQAAESPAPAPEKTELVHARTRTDGTKSQAKP